MEEEYKTFRDWFIKIPAKIVSSARNIYIKMAKHYHAAQRWTFRAPYTSDISST
ncbi:MAG: hypothetical protein IPO37_23400 [Saprospiraceae bacterium]|nr:hypothetical protein [Saprospiraceae bacterium]